jgi:hypothetical protein
VDRLSAEEGNHFSKLGAGAGQRFGTHEGEKSGITPAEKASKKEGRRQVHSANISLLDISRVHHKSIALPAEKQRAILGRHNAYRCIHGVPLLEWNDAIAANAQKWADEATATWGAGADSMQHSPDEQTEGVAGFDALGENLAWNHGVDEAGVDAWYDEIGMPGVVNGLVDHFGAWGHYTQVVWKSTTDVGCGYAGKLLVCQYGPAGNYEGEYASNLQPPTHSRSSCGLPELAATLEDYVESLKGETEVDCALACKIKDATWMNQGWGTSGSNNMLKTTCKCSGGDILIECRKDHSQQFSSCTEGAGKTKAEETYATVEDFLNAQNGGAAEDFDWQGACPVAHKGAYSGGGSSWRGTSDTGTHTFTVQCSGESVVVTCRGGQGKPLESCSI